MLPRSPWRTRGTAARAVVVSFAAVAVAMAVALPAHADPSDQPGGTSGVLDSSALDELQQRAAAPRLRHGERGSIGPPLRSARPGRRCTSVQMLS